MSASEEKKTALSSDDESYKKMVDFLLKKFFLEMEVAQEKGKILGQLAGEILDQQKIKKIKQVINKH